MVHQVSVNAAIPVVKRMDEYEGEGKHCGLLPLVEYRLASDGAMTVENNTADFYRHIDFTRIAEDFFGAVEETLKNELLPERTSLAAVSR